MPLRQHCGTGFSEKTALVIVFSCNHCPYVQAYEDRINAIAREYAPKNVALIAINANNVDAYPDDNLDEMVNRVRAKGFVFPYVRDDRQEVATAYGAECTPEVFIVDGKGSVCYHGGIDDNYREPDKVEKTFLRTALDDLVAGRPIAEPETRALGCSIKWAK